MSYRNTLRIRCNFKFSGRRTKINKKTQINFSPLLQNSSFLHVINKLLRNLPFSRTWRRWFFKSQCRFYTPSTSQLGLAHFKGSVATCVWWLWTWTALLYLDSDPLGTSYMTLDLTFLFLSSLPFKLRRRNNHPKFFLV